MSYSATVVEIFLSSPGDVKPERELILSYAAEWNRLRSRGAGCFISILSWEEMVAPALGNRSQEVINDQIGSSYDVFLGVMWTRLGTPTGIAQSGTVEEFEAALNRVRRGDQLRIATLFKRAQIDPETVDLNQLQKVREFRETISKEGAFYRDFSDEDSLRSIVMLLFEQIAKERDRYELSGPIVENDAVIGDDSQTKTDEEEIGLIEIGEEFEKLSQLIVIQMQKVAEEENRNTETLSECSEEISGMAALGNFDQKAIKVVIKRSADSLNSLSSYYEGAMDPLEDLFDRISRLVEEDLRIRLDFDNPREVADGNIEAMKELSITITTSVSHIDELILATSRLPRLSMEIARAKNRLTKSRQRLRQMMVSFQQSVDSSIAFFEKQVSSSPAVTEG